ncbi:Subunit of the glycosylphosphatidylinositol transamidase complex-like protein [Elasticomyces elasticus]|nr:Subunit of the glycosylphosphatidylinositol transamidase complex-like protein [Elasticomyces elasticus]KAK3626336.1 Subunit of the glycosylphosphatidylinositol transamidase complex-like protein [Elasticomyces elasticus]KAK4915961.1 Subunit of the glycosylphosphatidylinositol transamidase complex-like protein [Elasticomyces elasticus]KAK5754014.1 Subunit of the glycosylphosphatidylinositol transamidase complex-like protein [Elasticomyces elasticus]
MLLSSLFLLPAAVLAQTYTEHLHLSPLAQTSHLLAAFNFTSTTPLPAYESGHFTHFPRSLAQILQHTKTRELHLRFAWGRWDDEQWGPRPRMGRREGGTGVEIWAWLDQDHGGDVEERWSGLVNGLSGLFCASLNFIDSTRTTHPVLSFDPEGTHADGVTGQELLHGTLPHEVVCTENLTPFLKLLPCKGKAGISSLLDGHKVFDANWQTMSIDVRPICPAGGNGGGECVLEIQQTVDVVLDVERSMRARGDPIPRPRPIEELECDGGKGYGGGDTCYPKVKEGEMGWSLSRIFGTPVRGSCHLGDGHADADITLEVPLDRMVNVTNAQPLDAGNEQGIRSYRLPNHPPGQYTDLALPQQSVTQAVVQPQPPLYATRTITGSGQQHGGMHAHLRNPHPYAQTITYFESLPWFLRPYIHTLRVRNSETHENVKLEKMFYTPAKDRERGTHLELMFTVSAGGEVELSYDFEKAVLRYTEYPPDANRGFDVAPAVIRVLPNDNNTGDGGRQGSYIRTTSLLLPLPTPDFSMPYNVIILTSTVIALGFGSIFNLLTRRFVLAEEVPASKLALRVKAIVGVAQDVVGRLKGTKAVEMGGDAVGSGKGDGMGNGAG